MAEEQKPKRLCSEIQLFELCTRETCTCKDGRYCTNSEMLAKFEAISEEDAQDHSRLMVDEEGDFEDSGYDEYDEHDDNRFDAYDNENEDEDEDEDE